MDLLPPDPARPAREPAPSYARWDELALLKRLLREPLLHFIVIAAALFAAYALLHPGETATNTSKRIELTADDLRQLEIAFTAQWHRPPTPEEAVALIEGRVREEIMFREALALGLDKDDTIVRRRMAQKMEFLAEDLAAIKEPTTAELQAWFAQNPQRFALPARASFRHLYFSPDRRGQSARDDALRALQQIPGEGADSKVAAALADRFMYQNYYGDRSREQVRKEFGPKFAQALFRLTPGSWQGPIESGFGWHLVWIETLTPERIPAFEDVESDVKEAWTADWRDKIKREAYTAMRAQYEVVLPQATSHDVASVPVSPLPVNEP